MNSKYNLNSHLISHEMNDKLYGRGDLVETLDP